jgi:Flp pilus assembly pilin Flp
MSWLTRFHKNQEAATAVEYAVMLGLILMAVIGTVALVGQNLSTKYAWINTQIQSAE